MNRKPSWIRVKAPVSAAYQDTRRLMRRLGLNTVCEAAACPNIGECWSQRHATVMIMGDTCTRACAFCNVKTGRPDPLEPANVAVAVTELIQGYGIAMTLETTEAELMRAVFPHPTLSEMLHESVLDAHGRVIHF